MVRTMNRPWRICFVAPAAYPVLAQDRSIELVGGAEVQQTFLAKELARRGHDVSMISMDFGQPEGERIHGVRLLKMHSPNAGLPILRFVHPRLTSVWSAMKRADADIYYQRAGGALTGFVAAFTQRTGGYSIFAGAHDSDFEPEFPLIDLARDRAIYQWGVRHASQIVVQTERQADDCKRTFGRSAVRINSCYEHVGLPARHEGVVLWVATFKPHKRPELFIELARRFPQFRFKLVGGPGSVNRPYFDALRRDASSLGNLEFTGFVPFADAEQHFDGASMLINTSVGEGFPNTFMQSWSRGMPTLSFFNAGALDGDQSIGCVARSLDAMADTLLSLKEQPLEWQKIGARAQRYFKDHHEVRRIVDDYESLFDDVLARRSASRASG